MCIDEGTINLLKTKNQTTKLVCPSCINSNNRIVSQKKRYLTKVKSFSISFQMKMVETLSCFEQFYLPNWWDDNEGFVVETNDSFQTFFSNKNI
jgi:hypothetical protein